jgi:plasmid stabilization system protein ParE
MRVRSAADGYVGRVVDFCNGLSIFPLRGTQRDDLLPGLRVTGFERRVTIAFVVTTDAVLIEGIFYGQNDLVPDPVRFLNAQRYSGKNISQRALESQPKHDRRTHRTPNEAALMN